MIVCVEVAGKIWAEWRYWQSDAEGVQEDGLSLGPYYCPAN